MLLLEALLLEQLGDVFALGLVPGPMRHLALSEANNVAGRKEVIE